MLKHDCNKMVYDLLFYDMIPYYLGKVVVTSVIKLFFYITICGGMRGSVVVDTPTSSCRLAH